MTIVRLSGGIGNQLFQFCFAKYISFVTKEDIEFDIGTFVNNELRQIEILLLEPNIKIFNNSRMIFSSYKGLKYRYKKLLFRLIPSNNYLNEDTFSISKIQQKKNNYLDGFWQTEYFINYLNDNASFDLIPNAPLPVDLLEISDLINANLSVSIHIRRGDYFSDLYRNIYGVCDIFYYEKAIRMINEKFPGCKIFVFSDDLNWVKNNIHFQSDVTYVENFDINPYWYIYLMSLCKHNIISNSSFSWWGAYLNKNPEKVVIAPQKWTLISDKTIALKEWIKI